MPRYSEEREIRTYAHLYYAAEDALEKARYIEEGRDYSIIACLVLSAFSIEGYFNHIGEKVIDYWAEIERISPLSKLKILYSHLGLEYDPSRRPIQAIIQLFRFRNFMAHAKTEKISGSITLNVPKIDPGVNLVEAEWEKFCNETEASRALEDIKIIIKTLHETAGYEGEEIGSERKSGQVLKYKKLLFQDATPNVSRPQMFPLINSSTTKLRCRKQLEEGKDYDTQDEKSSDNCYNCRSIVHACSERGK